MNVNAKLWTGKTPRQELFQAITLKMLVNDWPVNDALEVALDGADRCPDGSMNREMLRWWEAASCAAQHRLLAEAKCLYRRQAHQRGLARIPVGF